ncbi:MAG: hypothetical protein NVS2B3_10460 [Vulcanimicrobiaceae bacterium]
MLRRVALATFASAVVFVVACGRQVTPDPTLNTGSPNLAGRMVVRFRTNGPLDFNKYTYAIVIDTCGGKTPYPNAFATTFNDYSFSFLVGGTAGTAIPALLQYIVTPGASNALNPQNVPLGASTTQLVLNSNQQNTEFQLTFVRAQLDNPLRVAQPCPNIAPSAVASASATAAATSAATANPTPNAQPTTFDQRRWLFNFFAIDNTTKVVVDSLGIGGAQDTSFDGIGILVDATSQNPIFRPAGSLLPADPHAQIVGGQIDNFK